MKVCIAADGATLDALVSKAFARCSYFLIVDIETEKIQHLSNDAKKVKRSAGYIAATKISSLGIQKLLCGDIGPNARTLLKQAGVTIVSGLTGVAREALETLNKKEG